MFELNGEPVDLDFLQGKAKEYNMDFDSYINKMKSKGLKKVELGKITPPKEESQGVPVEVNATPEIQPTVTELPSEDISLVSSEQPKTGTTYPTINVFNNNENKKKPTFESKYNLPIDKINISETYGNAETYFENLELNKKSPNEISKTIQQAYNDLVKSNKTLLNFNKKVEELSKKEIDAKAEELIKKYDLGVMENNVINPLLNAPDSPVYKQRLTKFNNELNKFYNDLVNKAYQSSENVKNTAAAIEDALNYEVSKYYDKQDKQNEAVINAVIEVIPGLNMLPEGDFRKNLFKLNFTLPQSFEQTAALFNAKEIQDYKSQINALDTREKKLRQQAKDEGWSEKVLKQQLEYFVDPISSKEIKGAKNIEDAKKYFQNKISTAQTDILQNLVESNEYQKEINKFGKGPEIFDEDGITWKDFSSMMGAQTGQVAQAALTLGIGTFIQEAGPAFIEGINKVALEKYSKFNEFSEKKQNAIYLDIINNNEINYKEVIATAGASAGLDLVGNFVVIGKATKLAPTSAFRSLLDKLYKPGTTNWKATQSAIKTGAKEGFTATLVETGTELAQETFNVLGVGAITKPLTNNKIDYDWSAKRFKEAGGQALITTGPLVSVGRGIRDVSTEAIRQLSAEDPGSIRSIINNQKKAIDIVVESKKAKGTLTQKDIDIASEEKDLLNTAENIANNQRYKKFEPEIKLEIFDKEVEITRLKRKNEKLKTEYTADNVFSAGQVQVNNNKIAELERGKEKDAYLQYYLVDGKKFRGYVNNNPDKFNRFKALSFETVNDAREFLKSQNIDLTESNIQGLLNGDNNAIILPNKKIFLDVKNNVKNNKDVLSMGVASNVVHHEAGHAIMNTFTDEEIQNVIKKIQSFADSLDKNSELYNVIINAGIRAADYESRGAKQRTVNEEFITSISDFLRVGMVSIDNVNVNDTGVLSEIGGYIGNLLDQKSEQNFNFSNLENGEQIIDFLKKYNSFNGKNSAKINLPKLKKVSVEREDDGLASADLKKLFDNFVQNEDGTKKYNTKKEFQQSADMFNAYKAILDPNDELDAQIAKKTAASGIFDAALQNFITSVKENLSERLIKNFDPAKNESLFGWMMGKTPVLQKAKLDVIAKYKKTKALEADLEIQKGGETITRDIISEELSIEDKIDLSMQDSDLSQGLIEPLEALTSDENIIKAFKNAVKENLPTDLRELEKINYKNLKDYAPKITAQIFGPKKENKQRFIKENAKTLYDLLPLGAMKKAVGLKTATGIQRTLINNFYKKGVRQTMAEGTAAGLNVQEKLPFNKNKFLEVFGALEGQKQNRNQPTAIKALETEIGKAITNRTVRKALNEAGIPDGIISTIADGKSDIMASAKLRPILFGTSKYNTKNINFKDVDQVISGRNAYIKLVERLGAENTMSYILPTIQNQWGVLAEGYVPNNKNIGLFQIIVPREKNDSEQVKYKTRSFLFTGRGDFFNTLSNTTNFDIKYTKGDTRAFWNSREIFTTKVPNQTPKGFNNGEFEGENLNNRVEFAELQRRGLKLIVKELRNLYNKGEISKNDLGMILSTFNSSISALVRTAAIPGLEFKVTGLQDEEYRYEHTKTASDVLVELAKHILNSKYSSFKEIMNDYRVAIIPKTYDNAINKVHRSNGPIDSKGSLVKGSGTKVARYTSKEALAEFKKAGLNPLILVDKAKADKTETMASRSLSRQYNEDILQATTGVKWFEKFSPVEARIKGKGKGKKFFIPYSADDFVGLLYTTLGKGKVGDKQMQWYQDNLLRPFSRGIQQYEAAKQNALREWQLIKKEAKKDVPGGLNKKNATGLTNQDAVRIFIWNEQGMEIPGTSNKLINDNLEVVKNNPKLQEFAERLIALNPEGYPEPSKNWDSGDITTDIVSYINDVKRSEFLTEFKENAEEIFSDQNKQKLRALYGDNYIEALDDILFRMTTGTNRRKSASKVEQEFMNWTNRSVGAIMFFNARSAVLQTLSAVNFINFSDNNPINAAIAFGKQKQYWNDFATLFNSDFLKQRRTGLQTDVNADEIARAAKGSENTARAALSALLKFGFTPTQIADSFAIASGGATFYRNRIKTYLKEGLTQKEAEAKAFTDFQEIAEETQQSARPDRISLQQASSLGRLVLAFANTPMQYARLTKKATLDLINGRGDWKTNVSKIAYYSVIQNIIFSALQQGLFALLFDDEDDDKEKSRLFRVGNSSIDTLLRGIGVYGAAAATVKNMILEIIEQSEKSRPDYTKIAIEATSISPPINSKLRKLESAGKTFTYKQSKEKVFTEGFSLENPALLAGGKVLSAATNLPADRVVQKADHIYTAMQPETELWQAIALSLGWSEWDLGMIESQTKKSKTPLRKSNARKTAKRKTAKRKTAKRKMAN